MNHIDKRKSKTELIRYLGKDLVLICEEIEQNFIVYEGQFENLNSLICKKNASTLAMIFSEKTDLDIYTTYEDRYSMSFIFYDNDKFSEKEALRMALAYQLGDMCEELISLEEIL